MGDMLLFECDYIMGKLKVSKNNGKPSERNFKRAKNIDLCIYFVFKKVTPLNS